MPDLAVKLMSKAEAQRCVFGITANLTNARQLLLDLYERKGWKALGHKTWAECLEKEFQRGQSTAHNSMKAAKEELALQREFGITANLPEVFLRQIASMPAEDRREVAMQLAASGALKVKDHRQIMAAKRSQLQQRRTVEAVAELEAEPMSITGLDLRELDCAALPWSDGEVQLTVTSPPYALDIPYADVGDNSNYSAYLDNVEKWCEELLRVTDPAGGRLCVNVPIDRSAPTPEPLLADWTTSLLRAGFTYHTTLLWHDNSAGRGNARGTVDDPGAPNVVTPAEGIIVVHRGEWNRFDRTRTGDLTHEQWLEWAGPRGLWEFPGESNRSLHPAPFPVALPERLIRLYSYRGDTIADPFCGRGTTALAALRLRRRCLAGDKSPTYVKRATAWISSQL